MRPAIAMRFDAADRWAEQRTLRFILAGERGGKEVIQYVGARPADADGGEACRTTVARSGGHGSQRTCWWSRPMCASPRPRLAVDAHLVR